MTEIYPTEFNFHYQIPGRDYLFNIKWDENKLFYKEFNPQVGINQQKVICPEVNDWAEFWHVLDEISIWDWYDEYLVSCEDSCVEGDEWEVNLVFGDLWVESHGANSYPATFREFIKATEELTGLLIEFIQQD